MHEKNVSNKANWRILKPNLTGRKSLLFAGKVNRIDAAKGFFP